MKKRYLLFFPIALCIGFSVWGGFIHWKFSRAMPDRVFYQSEIKTWSHRGFSLVYPENSLKSIEEAVNRGYPGVEIDVYFQSQEKKFKVSHDLPNNNRPSEDLFLSDVFEKFNSKIKFWIDFKNLETLGKKEIHFSVTRLSKLDDKYNIKDDVIIESKSASNLKPFQKAGFHTSYWAWLPHGSNIFYRTLKLFQMKREYVKGPFSAISLHSDLFTKYQNAFEGKYIHVFTVNDDTKRDKLINVPEIKIVLTDTLSFQ